MKVLLSHCGLILFVVMSASLHISKADLPEDCSQVKATLPFPRSGIYEIQPAGINIPFKVYCEMRPDGDWIVFQRRSGGLVSFERKWSSYKFGFGSQGYDHWLGLEKVHLLTKDKSKSWTLRVDLWDHEGGTAYATYSNFMIGDEQSAYKLKVGRYSGNAGDAIRGTNPGIDQNGFGFSTIDRDNDGCSPCIFGGDMLISDCASLENGGWWYSRCGSANLNGQWHSFGDHLGLRSGLHWRTWKSQISYSAQGSRMMIKSE